jgi:flagellar biogenesis protein FliO
MQPERAITLLIYLVIAILVIAFAVWAVKELAHS